MYSRICTFKKFGRYFSFMKDFNDEKHENNYIDLMINKGYNFVGIYYVDDNGEPSTEDKHKHNLYTKN